MLTPKCALCFDLLTADALPIVVNRGPTKICRTCAEEVVTKAKAWPI